MQKSCNSNVYSRIDNRSKSIQKQENIPYQPNTTQIPNIIFDYWMGILGNAEFKVLLCICRKTFGWHKKQDKISKTQISEMTQLSKDIVRKAIRHLQELNLIKCHESISERGYSEANLYEINVFIPTSNKNNSEGDELVGKPTPGQKQVGVGLPASGGELVGKPTPGQKQVGVGLPASGGELADKPRGGLVHKQGVGLPASPTKQSLTKPTNTKRQCQQSPQPPTEKLTTNQQALNSALPYSMHKNMALDGPFKKQSSRKKPLNEEQAGLVVWLSGEKIQDASYDTLTFWACNYSQEKILSAIDALRHEIDKGTQFKKSQAAFMRACLDGKIIPIDENIQQNKTFAIKFAEKNNWNSLKVFEKYVKDNTIGDDLNLYMPHNQFAYAIEKLYEKSILY